MSLNFCRRKSAVSKQNGVHYRSADCNSSEVEQDESLDTCPILICSHIDFNIAKNRILLGPIMRTVLQLIVANKHFVHIFFKKTDS